VKACDVIIRRVCHVLTLRISAPSSKRSLLKDDDADKCPTKKAGLQPGAVLVHGLELCVLDKA
jgi:hypothetical protein